MLINRAEGTLYCEEVLERILDRGIVVDGSSHLAAIAEHLAMHAEAIPDLPERLTPVAVLCPPRSREREIFPTLTFPHLKR